MITSTPSLRDPLHLDMRGGRSTVRQYQTVEKLCRKSVRALSVAQASCRMLSCVETLHSTQDMGKVFKRGPRRGQRRFAALDNSRATRAVHAQRCERAPSASSPWGTRRDVRAQAELVFRLERKEEGLVRSFGCRARIDFGKVVFRTRRTWRVDRQRFGVKPTQYSVLHVLHPEV